MKPKEIEKKAYYDALIEFRDKHIKEMERNMEVAISIRDDKSASAKSRNDAIRLIAQMLAGLQSESKAASKSHAGTQSAQTQTLSKDEIEEIEQRLHE